MIKFRDGKLEAQLLSHAGRLSGSIINQYNYIEFKNEFEEIVDILATNMLVHAMYQEYLKYEITDDLQFIIAIDEEYKDVTIDYNYRNNKCYKSYNDTSIVTLNRRSYDTSITLCMQLLKRVKKSFDNLNEIEKFIIKSLEFDNPKSTDEELIDSLSTYKNEYYLCKKSAYIKLVLQLNINNVKKREDEDMLKKYLADQFIITISNNS